MNKQQKESLTRFIDAANEVLFALLVYRGDTIIADEHQLHIAVVRLERCSRDRNAKPGVQSHSLLYPANGLWYRLLDLSRDLGLKRKIQHVNNDLMPSDKETRIRLAAEAFDIAVRSQKELARRLLAADPNGLPIRTRRYSDAKS